MGVKQDWDAVELRVERISNGFIVRTTKDDGNVRIYGEQTFYPTMESIERELVFGLRSAAALTSETGKADF